MQETCSRPFKDIKFSLGKKRVRVETSQKQMRRVRLGWDFQATKLNQKYQHIMQGSRMWYRDLGPPQGSLGREKYPMTLGRSGLTRSGFRAGMLCPKAEVITR